MQTPTLLRSVQQCEAVLSRNILRNLSLQQPIQDEIRSRAEYAIEYKHSFPQQHSFEGLLQYHLLILVTNFSFMQIGRIL